MFDFHFRSLSIGRDEIDCIVESPVLILNFSFAIFSFVNAFSVDSNSVCFWPFVSFHFINGFLSEQTKCDADFWTPTMRQQQQQQQTMSTTNNEIRRLNWIELCIDQSSFGIASIGTECVWETTTKSEKRASEWSIVDGRTRSNLLCKLESFDGQRFECDDDGMRRWNRNANHRKGREASFVRSFVWNRMNERAHFFVSRVRVCVSSFYFFVDISKRHRPFDAFEFIQWRWMHRSLDWRHFIASHSISFSTTPNRNRMLNDKNVQTMKVKLIEMKLTWRTIHKWDREWANERVRER